VSLFLITFKKHTFEKFLALYENWFLHVHFCQAYTLIIMKKFKYLYRLPLLAIAAGFFLGSCAPEIDAPSVQLSAGSADFTKYIAVGNSLAAGFSNGGLYNEGIEVSYPNLIAQQLKLVGGGNFAQPYFPEAQKNGSGYLRLTGFNSLGLPVTETVVTGLAIRPEKVGVDGKTVVYTKYSGALNNFGIPGIKVADVDRAGYGYNNPNGFNSYYERLLPNDLPLAGTPYIQFVGASKPTFFTCWLGNNDVLENALSGGLKDFTPDSEFETDYTSMITVLTAGGAKGVVATIPDVVQIAHFNAVTVAAIRARLSGADLYIETGSGANKGKRAATDEDYILLTASTLINTISASNPIGLSPDKPIPTQYILDKDEAALVRKKVTDYNTIIRNVAGSKDLPVVDAGAFINTLVKGQTNQGLAVTTAYITGGLFSLDGIHLTPRGNALAANEFIKAINQKYSSTIPTIDISKYQPVVLP
jgi:hypothetical protein